MTKQNLLERLIETEYVETMSVCHFVLNEILIMTLLSNKASKCI